MMAPPFSSLLRGIRLVLGEYTSPPWDWFAHVTHCPGLDWNEPSSIPREGAVSDPEPFSSWNRLLLCHFTRRRPGGHGQTGLSRRKMNDAQAVGSHVGRGVIRCRSSAGHPAD